MKIRLSNMAAAVAALAMTTSTALAQMSFTTYAEPTNPNAGQIAPYSDRISARTNGDLSFEIYFGGSLIPPRDALTSIGQGVAPAGQHVSTYSPSVNPLWAGLADIAFKVPDPLVVSFASTEYMLLDPEGRGEWLDNNTVSLIGFATTSYYLLCKDKDMSNLAALKGKKIRAPGAPWARFVQSIGAADTAMTTGEMYTALERGMLDCALADPSHVIVGATLKDILGSIVTLDVGLFFPGSSLLFNRDVWLGFTSDQRRILLEEAAQALVDQQVDGYIKLAADGMEAAAAAGIKINEPAEDLSEAYDQFLAGIDEVVVASGKSAGIDNIEQEVQDFTALLSKWQGLLETVDRSDKAALMQLVKSEIYEKVDPETVAQR